jgi:hypothetical protein
VRVGQRLSRLKVVLGVEVHAAKKSAAIERVGHVDGRLKARAHRVHPERCAGQRRRSSLKPAAVEEVKQIPVGGLIVNAIVAITRWQSLPGRGCRGVAVAHVGKQIAGSQSAPIVEHIGHFAERIVVVVNLQNRTQLLGRQPKSLLTSLMLGVPGPRQPSVSMQFKMKWE